MEFPIGICPVILCFDQQPLAFASVGANESELAPEFEAKELKNELSLFQLLAWIGLRFVPAVIPNANLTGTVAALTDRALVTYIAK